MNWFGKKAKPLPPMPESPEVERLIEETNIAQRLLRRLSVTVAFTLDEREFHAAGPQDIDRLMS